MKRLKGKDMGNRNSWIFSSSSENNDIIGKGIK
jgi:hypothetical protein